MTGLEAGRTLSKTWVVPPEAASRGRQGSESSALKRHLVSSSVSLSSQPETSRLMSSLQAAKIRSALECSLVGMASNSAAVIGPG